jgi:hypothetical protein
MMISRMMDEHLAASAPFIDEIVALLANVDRAPGACCGGAFQSLRLTPADPR